MLRAQNEIHSPRAIPSHNARRLRIGVQHQNVQVHLTLAAAAAVGVGTAVARKHTWVVAEVGPLNTTHGVRQGALRRKVGPHHVVEVRVRAGGTRVRIPYQSENRVVPQLLGNFLDGGVVGDDVQARGHLWVVFALSEEEHYCSTCRVDEHGYLLFAALRWHLYCASLTPFMVIPGSQLVRLLQLLPQKSEITQPAAYPLA